MNKLRHRQQKSDEGYEWDERYRSVFRKDM